MKVEPLGRTKKRPFALVTPGRRELIVETIHGRSRFSGKRDVENALYKLKDFTVYVENGLQRLRHTTGASSWILTTWKDRDVKITHVPSGVVVTSLRGILNDSHDPFLDLATALSWVGEFGVNPASVSSMAWQLLRASLSHTVSIGAEPELARPAFYGGRQQISESKAYKRMTSYDIRAAYPSAMAARPVSLSLREVDPSTYLNPMEAGIAVAKVRVPDDLLYPPLPVRLDRHAIQFQYGEIEGTWTWCELAAAMDVGAEVEVVKCYAPGRTMDLFSTWWQMAQTGRSLPGNAAKLAKAIANSTWGQMAMMGDGRKEVAWTDDRGEESYFTELPGRRLPHEWTVHVAAEVTSRVRVQTLLEGLYGVDRPIAHVDTDGIIVPFNTSLPPNSGSDFGQWQTKENMKVVEIRAPQFYRYQRPNEDAWHYVAAGMNEAQAAYTFTKYGPVRSGISFLSDDVVLPPGNAHDTQLIAELLAEAATIKEAS